MNFFHQNPTEADESQLESAIERQLEAMRHSVHESQVLMVDDENQVL